MVTVPLIVRDECPHLEYQAGEVISIHVDAQHDDPAVCRRLALQAVDNLRQGFISATIAIDEDGHEVVIRPANNLPTMLFDLPGRQAKDSKAAFARCLIGGGCNGYLVIDMLPEGEA